nr:hypothetical protein [uncultured Roseateles sp.]
MQRDGQYRGVSYRVESTPTPGGAYLGRYQLLDTGRRRHDATDHEFLGGGPAANDAFGEELDAPPARRAAMDAAPAREAAASGGAAIGAGPATGAEDVVHPSLDAVWATENEALSYATEAACHAIEIMQLGRPQAQGRGSGSSWRRTDTLGQ